MEALFVSAGVVALAELGDKTQLLAILLAARFRAPLPIILGILVATAFNHGLAAALGNLLGDWLSGDHLRIVLAVSFAAIAVWMLLPESVHRPPKLFEGFGAFGATLVSFFLVEIGDTTQLATMVLAARYHSIVTVAVGTTAGILIADVPAVYLGHLVVKRIPLALVRGFAAAVLIGFAFATLAGWQPKFITG
jgi:putative Ca2+/H+ antiporter (TMEM165/GDT1 family)